MTTLERTASPSRLKASAITAALIAAFNGAFSTGNAASDSADLLKRGAYAARAGDCGACHSAQKGQPFAGGKPFPFAIGTVFSTNITPDLETGIGRYDADDFVKALREGVAKDGHRLYPAMPYPSYAKVLKDDLVALHAHFRRDVASASNANRPAELCWLLGARSFLAIWNALYFTKGEYAFDPAQSLSWNRGAYLVQGLGHCGACHTPRGLGGQEKAGSEREGREFLAGATLENWHVSPLTGDVVTGLHGWTKEAIVEFLGTGRTERVAAVGVMAEVVGKSTQYLSEEDLMAIAEYLKTLPPSSDEERERGDLTPRADGASAATRALRAGDTGLRGALVYLDNCNACHRSDGSGASRTFPSLARSEAVNGKDPISLIHIVLAGSSMPSTQTAPTAFSMPGFGWRLSDAEVADVLSFIRGSWANRAAAVSAGEVERLRKTLDVKEAAR
jgi:mono/diheme cytochrome c family protein